MLNTVISTSLRICYTNSNRSYRELFTFFFPKRDGEFSITIRTIDSKEFIIILLIIVQGMYVFMKYKLLCDLKPSLHLRI